MRKADYPRWVSSAVVMALASLLLMAESDDYVSDEQCKTYAAFDGPFDYTTDCQHIPEQGHVLLAWDPASTSSAVDLTVQAALKASQIVVPFVHVGWDDACAPASLTIGHDDDPPLECDPIGLPISVEQHVECHAINGATSEACTLIVTPASSP